MKTNIPRIKELVRDYKDKLENFSQYFVSTGSVDQLRGGFQDNLHPYEGPQSVQSIRIERGNALGIYHIDIGGSDFSSTSYQNLMEEKWDLEKRGIQAVMNIEDTVFPDLIAIGYVPGFEAEQHTERALEDKLMRVLIGEVTLQVFLDFYKVQ